MCACRQANVSASAASKVVRRATICLPLLSVYFATSLMVRDALRCGREWSQGNRRVAALFGAAAACDSLDVMAQVGAGLAVSAAHMLIAYA